MIRFSRSTTAFALCLSFFVVGGCGSGSTIERAEVSGQVSVDGTLVDTGVITFVPIGKNKGPSAGAEIVNGSFTIPKETGAAVGQNRVQIIGSRKTGRKAELPNSGGMMVDELIPMVPTRYNGTNSDLVRTVKPESNTLKFDVYTKTP